MAVQGEQALWSVGEAVPVSCSVGETSFCEGKSKDK